MGIVKALEEEPQSIGEYENIAKKIGLEVRPIKGKKTTISEVKAYLHKINTLL